VEAASNECQRAGWRIGGTQDHPHLRTFVCTDHDQPGAEPWAEEVERWLNDDRNLPGVKQVRDIEFHCGYIDSALAAVGTWRPDYDPWEAPDERYHYVLPVTAVAWKFRRKGGGLADAAIARVLAAVDQHALDEGATEVVVIGRVHRENVAAQLLMEVNRFSRYPLWDTSLFETWVRRWPGRPIDPREDLAQT
jgi:hypothetical protein